MSTIQRAGNILLNMKITQLMSFLEKAKNEVGDVEVIFGSFCGTNNGHVSFDAISIRKNSAVRQHITGHGKLSIEIAVSPDSRKSILDGRKNMNNIGYKFFPSQYRRPGEMIESDPRIYDDQSLW